MNLKILCIYMPLNMKVFLCSNTNLLDFNECYLPAGKYYFNVNKFTKNGTVIGNILKDNAKLNYEFKYFTLMTLMAKAQSYLARRANIVNENMPNYGSPKNLPLPKFMKVKRKKLVVKKNICSICLDDEFENNDVIRELGCGHFFHLKCLKEWKKHGDNCPNCRVKIDIKL